MKKLLKYIGGLALVLGFLTTPVYAEWWAQNAPNSLVTNSGNGPANADIHVAHCYIGLGTGTPCGSGGASGVTSLNTLSGALTIAAGTGISVTPSGGNTLTIANTSSGGVTAIGPFGSSPNANGGTISGFTLTLQPASISFPGGVTTGTQTFAGIKTTSEWNATSEYDFNGNYILSQDEPNQTLVGGVGGTPFSNLIGITSFGVNAGTNLTAGATNDVLVGDTIGGTMTTSSNNVCVGHGTCQGLFTGGQSAIVGSLAGQATTGSSSILGYAAGQNDSNPISALGWNACNAETNTGDTCLGYSAGILATGQNDTYIGFNSAPAIVAGNNNTIEGANNLIGTNTATTSYFGAGSGKAGSTGTNDTILGFGNATAITSGANDVFIGASTGDTPTSAGNVVIVGSQSNATATGSDVIVLGSGISATTSNQAVIGSSGANGILNIFIGKGVTSTTASAQVVFQTTGGSGTDNKGSNLTLQAGIGTGAVTPALIVFRTTTATTSGSTAQATSTRGTIDGLGNLNWAGSHFVLDINGNIVKLNNVTTNFPSSQGAANAVLVNDGSGNLTWGSAIGSITIGAIDGNGASANGASISGSSIFMQSASATNPGLVNTTTQTFAGAKTTSIWNATSEYDFGGSFFAKQDNINNDISIGVGSGLVGQNNVFEGVSAGAGINVSGTNNSFYGYSAGQRVTTGVGNTLIGSTADTFLTTGSNNTAVGFSTGNGHATGDNNTYLGYEAGLNDASGTLNTYVGASAGFGNGGGSTGQKNVAVGVSDGDALTSASQITLIGYHAGTHLTSGGSNVLVGYQSGTALTTATGDTFIGPNSDTLSTTGSDDTLVGNGTYAANFSESVALGNSLDITANNQVLIGNFNNTSAVGGSDIYLGNGVQNVSAGNVILQSTGGIGTDINGAQLTLAGGKSTGAGVPGSVIFSTSTALTSGTTLQTLSERARIDGATGSLLIGTTTSATNASLVVKNGHIKSTQTTAPTTTVLAGAGAGGTVVVADATDIAGNVTIVAGAGATPGSMGTILFNKTYATAPVCTLTPTNASAAATIGSFIQNPTVNGFDIADVVALTNLSTYTFNYHCIETQ